MKSLPFSYLTFFTYTSFFINWFYTFFRHNVYNVLSFFFLHRTNLLPIFLTARKRTIRIARTNLRHIKLKKALFRYKFKFITLFFLNNQKQLNNLITKLPKAFNTALFYILKSSFFIDRFQHPIVGSKIFNKTPELKQKKEWDIFMKSFFIKRIRRWFKWNSYMRKKQKLLKVVESASKETFKHFYFNHLFYFFTLRLSYKRLKFVAKHTRITYPIHFTKLVFQRPYAFLYTSWRKIPNIPSNLTFVCSKFRSFKKVMKTFRRLNFKKKHKAYQYTQRLSKLIKRIRLKRRFFNFYIKNKKFNFKNLTPFNFFVFPTSISQSDVIAFMPTTTSFDNQFASLSFRRTSKLIRISLRKNYKTRRKNFYSLTNWFKLRLLFKKYRRFTLQNPKSILNFWKSWQVTRNILIAQVLSSLIKNKLFTTTSIQHLVQWNLYKNTSYQNNVNTNDPTNFKDSYLLTNYLCILSQPEIPFYFQEAAFLLLSDLTFLSSSSSSENDNSKLKQLKYSFSFRDDLSHHILKKYTYNQIIFDEIETLDLFEHHDLTFNTLAATSSSIINDNIWQYSFFKASPYLKRFLYDSPDFTSHQLSAFVDQLEDDVYKPEQHMQSIRFKPGYMRYWRRARKALLLRLKLPFKYQHQLTFYLLTYKQTSHLQYCALDELKLQNILVRSRLVLDSMTAAYFINFGLIFVNGVTCKNLKFQLCAGDILQCIISFKYYITFRWLLNQNLKIKTRIKNMSFKRKDQKHNQNPDKKYSQRLPLWLMPHTNMFIDIVKYLEVDFFTLSAFILYDPFLWDDTNIYNETILKPQIYNMYNWKYLT